MALPMQSQFDDLRAYILAGVDSVTLGPMMVATLLDESYELQELHDFAEAFGLRKILCGFGDDREKAKALMQLLGAEETGENAYQVRFETYIGCFWLRQGKWAWYPRTLGGEVIEAPRRLIDVLAARQEAAQ